MRSRVSSPQMPCRTERLGNEVRALVAKDGRTLAARPLSDMGAIAVSSIAQMLSFPQVSARPSVRLSPTPFLTLTPTKQAPYKFRCQAQVVAMAPVGGVETEMNWATVVAISMEEVKVLCFLVYCQQY